MSIDAREIVNTISIFETKKASDLSEMIEWDDSLKKQKKQKSIELLQFFMVNSQSEIDLQMAGDEDGICLLQWFDT